MTAQAPTVCGRLNAFQRVMLQWSSLHPYNAGHAFKIAGPLRSRDLTLAVAAALKRHGLGIVQLAPDGPSYRHETLEEPEVEVIAGEDQPEGVLTTFLSRALNQQFTRPTSHPFRFTAVDAGPLAHYVVLVYDHWVADSYSARLLVRSVLNRYCSLASADDDAALGLYPGTYREVFRRRLHGSELAMSTLRAMGQWNRNRSAWRVACWSNTQWAVDYRHYPTIPGAVTRLREFARANGATVHDVFLAAFGRALAAVMPPRGRENGLALGSIVDTRSIADEDLGQAMGAFLGYYLVRDKPDLTIGLDEATRQMAARTGPIKARHYYMDSLVNMQFINMVWPWLSSTGKCHFMRKALPMSGGISNVVVRDRWMNDNRHVILDYRRGVSTGPSVPIVLSPTTFRDHLNIGVSYRTAGFCRAKIDALMEIFCEQIEHPTKASRSGLRRRRATPAMEPAAARLRTAVEPAAA